MIYIYGKANCSDCLKLTSLLILLNIEYKEYLLDKDYTINGLKRIVPDLKSIPQVFDGMDYIGDIVKSFKYFSEIKT